MGISIKTSGEAGRLRIAVAGEVDVSNADELREAADKALATNPASLEVDLAEVPYIDSTGIGVLVGVSLVLCIIIAAVLEMRTRKTYVDRGPSDDEDEWSFFDDDDEGESGSED